MGTRNQDLYLQLGLTLSSTLLPPDSLGHALLACLLGRPSCLLCILQHTYLCLNRVLLLGKQSCLCHALWVGNGRETAIMGICALLLGGLRFKLMWRCCCCYMSYTCMSAASLPSLRSAASILCALQSPSSARAWRAVP